jgi:hypothetical protein
MNQELLQCTINLLAFNAPVGAMRAIVAQQPGLEPLDMDRRDGKTDVVLRKNLALRRQLIGLADLVLMWSFESNVS